MNNHSVGSGGWINIPVLRAEVDKVDITLTHLHEVCFTSIVSPTPPLDFGPTRISHGSLYYGKLSMVRTQNQNKKVFILKRNCHDIYDAIAPIFGSAPVCHFSKKLLWWIICNTTEPSFHQQQALPSPSHKGQTFLV